jgi:VanZ family protein
MERPHYQRLWLGAGILALALGLLLALLPLGGTVLFSWGDKLLHFLGFAILALWFLGAVEPRHSLVVVAGLAGYGVLIEVLQSLTPYRSADPFDVLSDIAGIFAGWLLASAGLRRWCRRVETLLGVAPP